MKNLHTGELGGRGRWLRPLLAMTVVLAACDFLDPTNVENPRTTDEDLAEAKNPTASLLPGIRAQFARMTGSQSVVAEVVSDNFSIHGTGLQKSWDFPRDVSPSLMNSSGTSTGLYWNAQELKALATFVLEEIAPGDETATADQLAEAHYYRGMAYLVLGENFSAAPVEADGTPVSADALLDLAVTEFGEAAGFGIRATAALARAHRLRGDAAAATAAAAAALAGDDDFAFAQEYDATSISNPPWSFLVSRALQEMQPLPRLDFLDPKYLDRSQGIVVAKAEEMHLILAEAALAGGVATTAQTELRNAILLAQSRDTETFDDEDPRTNGDLTCRPRDASIEVRADPTSPYRGGLVLTRPGVVTQHEMSGTSLDGDSVAALPTADELWHALHLARQEILFLEGRRMSDLGIRLPIMLDEIDANTNISSDPDDPDPGTAPVVPAYIPAGDNMDLYTPPLPYSAPPECTDLLETQITMLVDMNRVLTDNLVSPFLN